MPTFGDAIVANSTTTLNGAVTVGGALDINSTLNVDGVSAFNAAVTFTDAITIPNDSIDSAQIAAGAIDLEHMSANSVDSDQYVDGSIDPAHFAASAVETAAIAAAAVTPVKLSAASVAPAANAACAILNTTTEILLTVSDATNTAISTTSSVAGQRIMIRAAAVAGGGSYTLAVTTGTLTLNSVGETALIQRNVANSAWFVVALTAGDAGGNAATIV